MGQFNKTIDYAFDSLWEEGGKTRIRIKRVGLDADAN